MCVMKVRMTKAVALVAVGMSALTSFTGALPADEAIPCQRRLPKNVVAYVSLRDASEFRAQWSKTLFGHLQQDDALADFRADVEKQVAESYRPIEGQIGLSLSELWAIPH